MVNNMEIIDFSKYFKKEKKPQNKYLTKLLYRCLITMVIFLVSAIMIKTSPKVEEIIYKQVYSNNIIFTEIKSFYDKYLHGISFLDKIIDDNTKMVFNEKLTYQEKSKYLDGVKLTVTPNYLIPILESGIIVFNGDKEGYGKTIIIQGTNGIDIWYGNFSNINYSLYDYVEKGSILGEIKDNILYLVYSKDGNILNYEEYLK